MDSDKLGVAIGALFATVVMAAGFFYTQLSGWEVAFRTAVTFVAVYVVTFVFVRILLAIAPGESKTDRKGGRSIRQADSKDMGDQE
ncbi:MAG: hypothetical protein HZB26_06885 [Candidatus Hydrogenedentes bacterium]|nr:hypothetical protein [Candidatus Hydrogenedentota bacterium]